MFYFYFYFYLFVDYRNKFTVLSGNPSYLDTISGLKKSIREKSIQTGETLDATLSSFLISETLNNISGPQSPDNEGQEIPDDHAPETHSTRRRKTKGATYAEVVPEDPQPFPKMVSIDPLSEISLSMAILARAQIEKSALPSFVQSPSASSSEGKTDCKNNVHYYLIAPNSAYIYCRSCGNIIRFDDKNKN